MSPEPLPFEPASQRDLAQVREVIAHLREVMEVRFTAVNQRLDRMEQRLDRLEGRIDRLDSRIGRQTVTLAVAMLMAVLGSIPLSAAING